MVYRFTDVVIDSRTGLNPRKNFVLGGGDNYYITIKDIYNGKVNLTDKTDKVDDEAIQIIKRRSRIKVGDVLFVSIGRIGETAIVTNKDDSWDVNESVFVFTLNDKIITPEYFCTMFQSQGVKQYLSGNSSGSTFKSIKMNQLERMTFDLPPVTAQKSITSKLTAVRRIIDLRTSQLAELDNLVKARFVELFNEWKCEPAPLKTFLNDITYGFTNPMPDATEGPWKITAKDVVNGKVNYGTARKTTLEAFEELTAKSKPSVGDVLLTKDGTLGRCAVVETDGICVNQSVAVLKCNERIMPKFLAILLQMPEYQKEMLKNAGGGTIKHIYITKVVDMLIAVPTLSQQLEFLSFVEQTDKSKVAVQKALDEAQMLFDSLMQKYFG